MTKLVIQIPCYNEEECLPLALAALPRALPGVNVVEWLVVDDGSTDRTSEVARVHGVEHVIRLSRHRGLAHAFMAALEGSLQAGADIIVNTDADNQYQASDIPKLIEPILDGRAEMVIGARAINSIRHFSPVKKCFQRLGSWVTRAASSTDVYDAPSGFRAISRSAAMRLHVFSGFTYTIETIIQAGQKGMAVVSVPISTNNDLRPSRLIKGLGGYIGRQVLTMIRVFVTYKPFRFFAVSGATLFAIGLLTALRFLYYYVTGDGGGHVQSLILSALLLGMGFFLLVVGLLADLLAVNRTLLEGLEWRLRRMEERLPDSSDTWRT